MKHTNTPTLPCNPDALHHGSKAAELREAILRMEAELDKLTAQGNSVTLPPGGPLDPLFRSIFDGAAGKHGRSDSAFQAVADGVATYGKAVKNEWNHDSDAPHQAVKPLSKAERKDKRQNSSWVRDFVPATRQPSFPAFAKQSNRVAGSLGDQAQMRVTVERVNAAGETEEFRFRLRFNVVSILSYGKFFEFRRYERSSGSFRDGRDGKSKPLSFAKSELRRLLGATEGDLKFAALTAPFPPKGGKAATLSPCNPSDCATVTPSNDTPIAPQSGHSVTGSPGGTAPVTRPMTLWEQRKAAATAGRANKRDERNWSDVNSVISLAEVAPR